MSALRPTRPGLGAAAALVATLAACADQPAQRPSCDEMLERMNLNRAMIHNLTHGLIRISTVGAEVQALRREQDRLADAIQDGCS